MFRNAEELNKLFMRNNDVKMLLSKVDRYTLDELIKELSEEDYSSSLQTFLSLQVGSIYCFVLNFLIVCLSYML